MNKFLIFICFSSIVLLSSCAKEEPLDPTDPTDVRAKFRGNWAVKENSKEYGPSTYNVTITDEVASTNILIAYLYSFKGKTVASVNQSNITIPTQTIDGVNVSGSGLLENSNRISLKYTVQITKAKYDTVIAVLTK